MTKIINRSRPFTLPGGQAIPIGRNFYYMKGRKHEQGGIDVGKNLEVESDEIVQTTPNSIKVFSAQPILNGISPAKAVLGGANPNKVFKAQEEYKDRFNLNDDGTKKKAKYGNEEVYGTPQKFVAANSNRPVEVVVTPNKNYTGYLTSDYSPIYDVNDVRIAASEQGKIDRIGKDIEDKERIDNGIKNTIKFIGENAIESIPGVDTYMDIKDIINSLNEKDYINASIIGGSMLLPFAGRKLYKTYKLAKELSKASKHGYPYLSPTPKYIRYNPSKKSKGQEIFGLRNSKLTEAERLGIPKSERNNINNSYRNIEEELDWTPSEWFSKRVPTQFKTELGRFNERRKVQYPTDWDTEDAIALRKNVGELKHIERRTKFDGTYLKIPDGSIYQGDPREWVMMQSHKFKRTMDPDIYYTGITPYVRGNIFNPNNVNTIWSSNNRNVANSYSNLINTVAVPKNSNVRYINANNNRWNDIIYRGKKTKTDKILSNEFINFPSSNGLIIDNVVDPGSRIYRNFTHETINDIHSPHRDFIIYSPTRKKFITGNTGDFNLDVENVYKRYGGKIKMKYGGMKKAKMGTEERVNMVIRTINNELSKRENEEEVKINSRRDRRNTENKKAKNDKEVIKIKEALDAAKQEYETLKNSRKDYTNNMEFGAALVNANKKIKDLEQEYNNAFQTSINKDKTIGTIIKDNVGDFIQDKADVVFDKIKQNVYIPARRILDGRPYNEKDNRYDPYKLPEVNVYGNPILPELTIYNGIRPITNNFTPYRLTNFTPWINNIGLNQSYDFNTGEFYTPTNIVRNRNDYSGRDYDFPMTTPNSEIFPDNTVIHTNDGTFERFPIGISDSKNNVSSVYTPKFDSFNKSLIGTDFISPMGLINYSKFITPYNNKLNISSEVGKTKPNNPRRPGSEIYSRRIAKLTDIKPQQNIFDNYKISPIKTDNSKMRVPTPTFRKPSVEQKINNFIDTSGINFGDIANGLSSLISYGINSAAINRMKEPSYPIPKISNKLKTNINVNPELDTIRETTADTIRGNNRNTSSSNVAVNRNNLIKFNSGLTTNRIYVDKENKETQLINQDRLNQQQVANANIDIYNQYQDKVTDFRNKKHELRSENTQALITGLNSTVQNSLLRRERDRNFKLSYAMIKAMHPEVVPYMDEIFKRFN